MSTLLHAYMRGWNKLAADLTPSNPTVANSTVLGNPKKPSLTPDPTSNPIELRKVFDVQEQGKTRLEPSRKLSAEMPRCTTCRQPKHYGPCKKPNRTRPEGAPLKLSNFNAGMTPDAVTLHSDNGEASPVSGGYNAATVADSSKTRARTMRPTDEIAASAFAQLPSINAIPDQSMNNTNALNKTARTTEMRGPTGSWYDGTNTPLGVPIASGKINLDAIDHAFGQIDNVADVGGLDNGGTPDGGPAVLG